MGVNARYWLGVWMSRWVGHGFPWVTFTINISGSFAIGFLTTLLAYGLPHPHARLFLLVGFLGGYTTFSTFAFESLTLWEGGAVARAWAYMIGSVAAGLVAVTLGTVLARGLVLRIDAGLRTSSSAPSKLTSSASRSADVGERPRPGPVSPIDVDDPEEA